MNKSELIEAVQRELGAECSKAHAERVVNTVLGKIHDGLRRDRQVQILGFGTFQVKTRAERTCRNPRTGEPMKVPASRTVGFRPGTALRSDI